MSVFGKCIDGQSFSPSVNETCRMCSSCPSNARVVQKCTPKHDTRCVCGKGFFMSTMSNECKRCTPCPHGWGVWRQCSRNRNAVCRKCPPGTYSGVLSGTLGCFLCKSCRVDQIMLQECSPLQDTVCVDKSISEIKHFSSSELEANAVVQYNEDSALIVYIAVLAVIICSAIAYFVFRCKPNGVTKKQHTIVNKVTLLPTNTARTAISYSPLVRHSLPQNARFGSHRWMHSDSLHAHKNNHAANHNLNALSVKCENSSVTANSRYCDLNSTTRRALEASLNAQRNDTRDWRALAVHLGYSQKSILVFEDSGQAKYGPSRHLLADWSKSENATVSSLLSALFKIGRVDSALIIDGKCTQTNAWQRELVGRAMR